MTITRKMCGLTVLNVLVSHLHILFWKTKADDNKGILYIYINMQQSNNFLENHNHKSMQPNKTRWAKIYLSFIHTHIRVWNIFSFAILDVILEPRYSLFWHLKQFPTKINLTYRDIFHRSHPQDSYWKRANIF
jgi:hypothetical protein